MESSAKLNRTRWAMQVALIIGLALLFLAAWLWGLQRTTMARTNPDDLGAGPIGSSPHDTPGGGAPRWTPLGGPAASGGQVNALAAHPAVAGTAYAAVAPAGAYDSGPSVIYKTTDGAASWTPVYTAEHQVYALGVSGSNVYAGAFNPGGEGPSLYVSQDSGVSWTPVFSFTERGVWSDLAVHPTDVDVAIVGGWAYHGDDVQSGLVYATDDAGMTWTPILTVTFPGIEGSVNGVMIHPITPTLLLASAHADDSDDSIIYRSEDGGATWPVSVTIPGAHVVSLAAHGSDGQMVYAGTGGSTFTEGPSVVLRSTDAGLSWTEVFDEGGGWVAFEAPNTVYATSGCDDVFRSTSGGDPGTWSKVESPEDCMRSFSAGVTPGVLYAGGEEKGVFKSSDGGDSWEERNEGIQSLLQAVDIDVDPENLDKLFAAAECGGGWMTTDGGETWMQPSGVSGCMGAFAINPDNLDVVYGGGYDDGRGAVMRSDDGGLTFERVYTASFILPDGDGGGEQIHALAIAPSMSATVYAAGADEPEGEDEHAVVVRSVDDGASWTEVFTGPEESEVRALAINPTDEDTVYAGGEDCSGPDCMGFIYRTIDGGDTWTEVFTTSETVHSIVIDQQTPELVYASADNYEVYKSSDGGGSWTVIRSCCPSGNLLAIDPHRSGRLYLAGWGYVAESSDGGQSWSDQGAPINQGVPRMEPRALVVDNGDVIQTLYAGFSGVWAYRRLAPQEGDRYVATTGSDADNPCVDPYAPCRTIGHAVEMANAGETVLVAQGTYTENLSVSKRVTLAGGYEAVNWTRDLTQYETVIDGSGSQTVWGDWDGNAIYAPAVITDAGVLRMWYTGADEFGTGRIGHAESADGVNWTRLITNPVLEIGAPGDWDEEGVGQPSVIKQGGLYQMWFFGGNDDGVKQVGYATSTNGIDWTKHPGNPVLTVGGEGAWDETEVGGPRVLFDGATYHLWYHGYSGSCCDSIGYATSPDGINWTKHSGNPVFGRGDPGEWDDSFILATAVLSDGGQLHMWYSTSWVDNAGIGYVTSTNGISWTRFLTGPVLPVGSPGEWDENYVSWPAVIRDGGAYRMWYRGHDDGWWVQFGYATSPDGIVWTRSVSNPVFSPGAPTQWGDPVVRFEGGSGGAVLDGFTITGGDAFAGGGLLIANGGSALVSNCTITGNQSHGWGGGVWVTDADATIRDSTISHNSSGGSAGIEVNHDFGPAYLDLVSCRVEHNVGGQIGGMQVWGDQAAATVVDVAFSGNEGDSGGAIALNNSSSIVISDTVVFSNTAYNAGAGIAVREGSSASIHGTQIYANIAQGGQGGGISAEGSDVSLTGSWVVGNVAQNNEGGGIAVGEGGSFYGENCIIAGNTSGTSGGGLWLIEDGPFQLVNCDVVGNDTAHEGGALATGYGTQIEITNTLIISNGGHTGIADRDESGSTITLGYCDTFGNSPDGTEGVTIVRNDCLGAPPEDGLDPLLSGGALPGGVGPAFATQWMSYDYRLEAASPAIGAGTPAGAPPADIEGTPRDATPDLGAYEWTGSCVYLPLAVRNYSAPTEVFKLGVLGPFSGPVSDTGDEFGGAVNMAFDAIDWRIGEYKIEPIWIDSESDPAKAAQNYEEAILQDGIEAGLLNWHSSVGVACMEVVADHQVPHFAGMGASIEVNETFNGDRERYGYWTTKWWPAPSKLNVSYVEMLEHAISSGAWSPAAKTVVISGEDTDWGHAFGDAIKYNLQAAGWTVLAEAYFSPGQTDFSSELAVLKTLNPTVVAGSSYSAVSVFALLNQAHAAELESVIILDGLGYMGDWYGETGDSSNYVLNQMPPGWITTEAQTFADAYEERYGESPSPSAAGLAYDAANFFINVAEAVYKETGELSSEALYQFVQDEVWTGQWSYTDGIMMEEYKYTEETIPDPVVGQGAYMFPVLQYFDGEGMIVFPPDWADQPFTPPGG